MESDDNVSGEFQRSTRMPLDAVVRLHFQGTVAYQNGFAANVSATGMFVKHPAPPPLGTQLVFEFNLGAERKPVQGAGEVVWVRDRYLGPGQPAGVGIRFLQLDTQSRDHIAEALFEYLEQSLAEDSLLDSSGFTYVSEEPAPSGSQLSDIGESGLLPLSPVPAAEGPGDRLATPEPQRFDFAGEGESAEADTADTAETFDFAAFEKLPQRGAPPAESKRAFSVFSPLDDADPQTAKIVREALREEPPLPSMAAAAAAASDRPGGSWRAALLVLVLVGAGGYFAWKQWGDQLFGAPSAEASAPGGASEAPAEPPPAPKPEPLTAAPGPGTLAQAVGVDPHAVSPAAAPPHSGGATAPPEEPSDVSAAAQSAVSAASAASAAEEPGAPVRPVAEPRPPAAGASTPPTDPAAASPAGARAERLVGIAWDAAADAPGQTSLILTGDAAFAPGSFSYSELGGENPRVLIRLKGMESPYRGAAPRGGGDLVRGVRTGFHLTSTGNEIHVVVDLARAGVKVLSLTAGGASGSALTLRLSPS
jgi:uncharacterized protein (TIGR02266 family)